ncbi:MAG TPA: HD domain-containing phosphohydrolase [Candidatus Dormibacteraeota bacterium]|nr:HD domain-containing phosphohydrolase [Candidatus Dormibacteraeota bacterium]
MNVHEGMSLGPYRVMERIGRGGMAAVYRAYHPGLDRHVAIKVLPDFFADEAGYRERFQQEARSVARLKHPNILEVFDFGYEDGVAYLVLELVEGGTLADRVGLPMELQDVVPLIEKIAGALDHAHARGILHRDLKPSNILIHTDGTPVLADFGLARMLGQLHRLTSSGTVMGTPEYMSPEQAADEPLGPESDVYSLAVVAYEMLTGRVPFDCATPAATLLSHVTKPMPPTLELKGELSAHVEEVLRKALSKRPQDRYASASAFATALRPAAWPERRGDDVVAAAPGTRRLLRPERSPVVLVVDDSAANRELIEACLADVDCEVRGAEDGATALNAIQASPPDLVLLDVQMPGMDGYEVCRRIKSIPASRLLPVVMITALDRTSDRILALEAGADDYMTKPVDRVELVARVRSALRLKSVYDSLDSAEQVIFALAAAVEAKDPFTEAHTQRVAESARRLGASLGMGGADLDALYRGGLIHDIGKIGIPDAILLKPGPLSADELATMHLHPIIGANIVAPLRSSPAVLPIIRHHHEHYDGGGYPDRLAGQAIPRLARVVAVCDAFDALINDRPYRARKTPDEAIAILHAGARRQWDPEVVDVFTRQFANVTSLGAA